MTKLIMIGGNRDKQDGPLLRFAQRAKGRGVDVHVITEPWHLALPGAGDETLGQALERNGITYECLNALDGDALKAHALDGAYCLLVSSIWLIDQNVIDLFPGRILNYHNAKLPQERGAAAYSWKILSGVSSGGLTIHHVVKALDQGRLVLTRNIDFPDTCRTTMDYYHHMEEAEDQIFSDLLDLLDAGAVGEGETQDKGEALYWPRLNTDIHGYINWDWFAREIEAFICAFDEPHMGASTFMNAQRIYMKGCRLMEGDHNFHPFQAGFVVRKHDGKTFIAARGGLLSFERIKDSDGRDVSECVRTGIRLYTPREYLDAALHLRVRQKPTGIEVK